MLTEDISLPDCSAECVYVVKRSCGNVTQYQMRAVLDFDELLGVYDDAFTAVDALTEMRQRIEIYLRLMQA